jgi:hypothetical protein
MTTPPTNPVHLFRALLRECTYLPDARARSYMHDYVLRSFRSRLPRVKAWRKELSLKDQVRLLRRGRKYLSLLSRANEGYLDPLERVLMMTYGRIGKRRRELMANLMRIEPPSNHEAVEQLFRSETPPGPRKLPAKLHEIARSQNAHRQYLDKFSAKFQLVSGIPKTNRWGKPMPASRVKNLTHRWSVKQLQQIYPPLPANEYQDLQSLASGEAKWQGPVPRRVRAQSVDAAVNKTALDKVCADGPPRGITFAMYVNGRPHQITARLMRRLWTTILRHVPVLSWNHETEKWMVTWQDTRKKPTLVATPSTSSSSLLFDT